MMMNLKLFNRPPTEPNNKAMKHYINIENGVLKLMRTMPEKKDFMMNEISPPRLDEVEYNIYLTLFKADSVEIAPKDRERIVKAIHDQKCNVKECNQLIDLSDGIYEITTNGVFEVRWQIKNVDNKWVDIQHVPENTDPDTAWPENRQLAYYSEQKEEVIIKYDPQTGGGYYSEPLEVKEPKDEQKKHLIEMMKESDYEQPEAVWFLEHISMNGTWLADSVNLGWTKDPLKAKRFKSAIEAQEYDDRNTENGNELHCYPTEHIFVEQDKDKFKLIDGKWFDENGVEYYEANGMMWRSHLQPEAESQEELWEEVCKTVDLHEFSINEDDTIDYGNAKQTLAKLFTIMRNK